ncbi:MAG: YggS family pyridoxal phosphate-dependent enzyme [Prevotellaceae bacterium]|jgi:pyridoxal phosphate enzyme (YggS family)|nr:YggS family pyridoxal phosphate-dependent enzyme [Prevotellaceae bacterium]
MSSIVEKYRQICLPANVQLIAVSKFQPESAVMELYEAGHRAFGESRVQELMEKHEHLPKDIQWHFIGHLQTNKIKYIVPFSVLIHGVDSFKLLEEIDKCAARIGKVQDCLLQIHIAREETKFGFSFEEANETVSKLDTLYNVRICGLMGMASYTDDEKAVRQEFRSLAQYFRQLKASRFADKEYFKELSMGMSGDYPIAIEEGATMLRIGSSIFGERNY